MNAARSAWLSQILYERYGVEIQLAYPDESTTALCLDGADGFIRIVSEYTEFSQAGSDLPYITWDAEAEGWSSPLSTPLPAPGAARLPSPLIEPSETGYTIHYDILSLVYWMLSRQEEVDCTDLDEHGRFPATASHAYRYGYLERPVVDEWLNILGQVIQRQWPALQLRRHQFSMMVSHDVDTPSRYGFRSCNGIIRAMAGDVLKRRNFKNALLAPWIRFRTHDALHRADPANTFDWIMDISEKYQLTSAFYFICGRTDPRKDADYEPEHPAIRSLMRHIHNRGHKIGLHPSYNTYQSAEAIAAEASRLRQVCAEEGIEQDEWGGRMHYLRWEQPTTMRAWAQAGMNYDSTLGYADRPGFRCGTCFEYQAFDPIKGEMINLRIRPLIAMECSIIASRYMGLGIGQDALDKFIQLKRACQAVGGNFTLLWHNSQLEKNSEKSVYEMIVSS